MKTDETQAQELLRHHDEEVNSALSKVEADRVIRNIDDTTLAEMERAAADYLDRFRSDDEEMPDAVRWAILQLVAPLNYESDRRQTIRDDERKRREANGHEVFLGPEDNHGPGRVWAVFCWCSTSMIGEDYSTSYEDAVRVGGAHAADHGGKWEPGEPKRPDDY